MATHHIGLRFGVGAMISPEATFDSYIDLKNYLAKQLGDYVTLDLRRSYAELNHMLRDGRIDVAMICSGAYIKLRREAPVELLAVPVIQGRRVYRSYIIVRQDSKIHSLREATGLRMAFTDPLSNTGYYYPMSRMVQLGLTPEQFFAKILFTGGHDRSIDAVRRGLADVAAVDNLVFDFIRERDPKRVAPLRIIQTSSAFGIPPVVARPGCSPDLCGRVGAVLRTMHQTPQGQQVLRALRIDRFTSAEPEAYASVAQMIEQVEKSHGPSTQP